MQFPCTVYFPPTYLNGLPSLFTAFLKKFETVSTVSNELLISSPNVVFIRIQNSFVFLSCMQNSNYHEHIRRFVRNTNKDKGTVVSGHVIGYRLAVYYRNNAAKLLTTSHYNFHISFCDFTRFLSKSSM